jgi:hypothetical protein
MDPLVPLPLVDDLIRPYNVGQALLAVFVLAVVGSIPLGSRKVLSLNLIIFGLLFLVTPVSLAPIEYKFLGIALLVASPVLYMTAKR